MPFDLGRIFNFISPKQNLLKRQELERQNLLEWQKLERQMERQQPNKHHRQALVQNEECSSELNPSSLQQKNISACAADLNWIAWFLNEEEKAHLTDLRIYWYSYCEINSRVKFKIWLKTQKYFFFDYLIPSKLQKRKDRFQSMERERLPKIK